MMYAFVYSLYCEKWLKITVQVLSGFNSIFCHCFHFFSAEMGTDYTNT